MVKNGCPVKIVESGRCTFLRTFAQNGHPITYLFCLRFPPGCARSFRQPKAGGPYRPVA